LTFRTFTTHANLFFVSAKVAGSSYINHFLQPDSLIPDPSNPQALNRYSYVLNRPVNFNDPTGHVECEPGTGCRPPGSTGSGGTHIPIGGSGGGGNHDDDEPHNQIMRDSKSNSCDTLACLTGINNNVFGGGSSFVPASIAPTNTGQTSSNGDKGYEGYSDSNIDALFFWWESVLAPINDIISLDDIYRISSRGGWKASRYSLNLGILEAIVQGSRQAYRDSWYQTLTPTQRFLRPVVVGGEALVTDVIAGKVGKGFGATGASVGGPLGMAGGYLGGQTFATKVMDRLWMEKFNPWAFSQLGAWP
jgi:hypothetical protein